MTYINFRITPHQIHYDLIELTQQYEDKERLPMNLKARGKSIAAMKLFFHILFENGKLSRLCVRYN